ncbi:hypothetical protein SKAU_G00057670 [Synaphobranchus kaupii]|uniref:Uncharacterized protein n=1 Tax=Synaphobranchus kaupii TaxID=118154 RepID=A0A9Q1G496_SYNKA|nr:hypothetical protein SKAU_G00057670 [Synaphobranchus kaupii]
MAPLDCIKSNCGGLLTLRTSETYWICNCLFLWASERLRYPSDPLGSHPTSYARRWVEPKHRWSVFWEADESSYINRRADVKKWWDSQFMKTVFGIKDRKSFRARRVSRPARNRIVCRKTQRDSGREPLSQAEGFSTLDSFLRAFKKHYRQGRPTAYPGLLREFPEHHKCFKENCRGEMLFIPSVKRHAHCAGHANQYRVPWPAAGYLRNRHRPARASGSEHARIAAFRERPVDVPCQCVPGLLGTHALRPRLQILLSPGRARRQIQKSQREAEGCCPSLSHGCRVHIGESGALQHDVLCPMSSLCI